MTGTEKISGIIILILLLNMSTVASAQKSKQICIHMKSQTLQNGKVLTTEADQYFSFPEGNIISYFQRPEEYVFISNPLGEAKIYRPTQNTVIIQSRELFTTKNNSLYFFLTNQTYDLGLRNLGLKVFDSEEDGQILITRWQAPPQMLNQVDKIAGPDNESIYKPCGLYARGSAANTITGLSKLGIDTAFIGKIGDGDYSKFLIDECCRFPAS